MKKTLIKYASSCSWLCEDKWSNGRKQPLSLLLCPPPARLDFGPLSPLHSAALSTRPYQACHSFKLSMQTGPRAGGRRREGEKSLQPLENKKLSSSAVVLK